MIDRADVAEALIPVLADGEKGPFGIMCIRTKAGYFITPMDQPFLGDEMQIGFRWVGATLFIAGHEIDKSEYLTEAFRDHLTKLDQNSVHMYTNPARKEEATRLTNISESAGKAKNIGDVEL